MNDSIRLTQQEIDTVVVAVGYNSGSYSAQLADARLIDLSLTKTVPPTTEALATTEQCDGEYDPATAAKKTALNAADQAVAKTQKAAAEVIAKYPARALTAAKLHVKLLSGQGAGRTASTFTFTKDETDFIVDGLRQVERLDIESARNMEVFMKSYVRTPTHVASAFSAPQTPEEVNRLQTVRDDFLSLYSKFVQYQRSFANTTANDTTANDQ